MYGLPFMTIVTLLPPLFSVDPGGARTSQPSIGSKHLVSCISLAVKTPAKGNGTLVTKQASGSAKIDPLMAAFNAIALMSTNPWSHQAQIFVILGAYSQISVMSVSLQ